MSNSCTHKWEYVGRIPGYWCSRDLYCCIHCGHTCRGSEFDAFGYACGTAGKPEAGEGGNEAATSDKESRD